MHVHPFIPQFHAELSSILVHMQLSQFPALSHYNCAVKSRLLSSLEFAFVMVRAWLVLHVLLCSLKSIGKLGPHSKLFLSSQHVPASALSLCSVVTTVSHWATVSMLCHTHCTRSCSRSRNCVNHHHTTVSILCHTHCTRSMKLQLCETSPHTHDCCRTNAGGRCMLGASSGMSERLP